MAHKTFNKFSPGDIAYLLTAKMDEYTGCCNCYPAISPQTFSMIRVKVKEVDRHEMLVGVVYTDGSWTYFVPEFLLTEEEAKSFALANHVSLPTD